jgi:hypothetical protein
VIIAASSAMTAEVDAALRSHLLRADGQEDLCFAVWRPSTGRRRRTALVLEPILPEAHERHVHGNASYEMAYALRAARLAAGRGLGIALLHAHPGGTGWQGVSSADRRAEAACTNMAVEITGLPLVGMTLAGADGGWSSRFWDRDDGDISCSEGESVRVVGDVLRITHNDRVRPRPRHQTTQARTLHAWGEVVQGDLARLRVLVVGAGSVGQHVAESIARTGIENVGVMDFDRVEYLNLDRLHGATQLDAALRRPKVDVARRTLRGAATAEHRELEFHELSVCEPLGLQTALDYDVVVSCVDRPWPRHVLNTIAYSDLIPVVDGGLRLDPLPGGGLRNAVWRSHTAMPGRPCLACVGQYNPSHVQLERDGSLDDSGYIASLPARSELRANENVSAFSVAVASALLTQLLALILGPSGMGDPGPLRHDFARHRIEPADAVACRAGCPYPPSIGEGDSRLDPTGRHPRAEQTLASDRRRTRLLRLATDRVGGTAWRTASRVATLLGEASS